MYKSMIELVRKYYKYITVEQTFSQPALSGNGTLGGDTFACNASQNNSTAYHAFDNTGWEGASNSADFIFYNPNKIKVTKIKIDRPKAKIFIYTFILFGSNDNSSWTQIGNYSQSSWPTTHTINNNNFYNYYKMSCYTTAKVCGISNMELTATEQVTSVVESTSSDYDFYKDVNSYKVVKDTIKEYYDELTFEPSSLLQEWVVPTGVTKIHVDCVSSKGANGGSTGGKGGRVQCDLNVTSGQTLYIVVGGIPESSSTQIYNASDIRTNNAGITNTTSLNSRLIVAGGGGNGGQQGGTHSHEGGNGGGLTGGAAPNHLSGGGQGGTQTAGGAHGVYISGDLRGSNVGTDGYFGLGGTGGAACGGAGWYGGGAGFGGDYRSFGVDNAGGGGGSSYTDSTLCSNVTHTQGYNNGEGYITISTLNGEHFYKDVTVYKAFKE